MGDCACRRYSEQCAASTEGRAVKVSVTGLHQGSKGVTPVCAVERSERGELALRRHPENGSAPELAVACGRPVKVSVPALDESGLRPRTVGTVPPCIVVPIAGREVIKFLEYLAAGRRAERAEECKKGAGCEMRWHTMAEQRC